MPFKTVGLVLFSVFLATVGQLMLKTGMNRVGFIDGARISKPLVLVADVLRTWQVLGGLAIFGLSALSWLVVMSRVPLSFAYPFVGITYVLLTLFSKFVLHEHVPSARWLGLALVVAGIIIVGKTSAPEPTAAPGTHQAATTTRN